MKFMNKLQDKLKKAKKDNKGFSLVELIIVIAIMAILVGIVGTQVIPYIDRSRHAKDVQVLSGLCTDAMSAYSSNAATLGEGTYVITIAATGASDASDADKVTVTKDGVADNSVLKSAFTELNSVKNIGSLGLESKDGKKVTKIEITCKNDAPMITVETTSDGSTFEDIKSK